MDSNSSRSHSYVRNIRGVRVIHEGGEISISVSNNVEDHSGVESDYVRKELDAITGSTIHFSAMGSISSILRGVRARALLWFIAGIIFSWIVQIGLAVLLTGP